MRSMRQNAATVHKKTAPHGAVFVAAKPETQERP